jgi:hypothetical protein
MVASGALDVAEGFKILQTALPGWTAQLSTPGMSTGGGRRAVEHIVLTSGRRTLVAGSIDFAARRAELRPYAWVRETFRERYGVELAISTPAYETFLGHVGDFFKKRAFVVLVRAGSMPPTAPASAGFPWLLLFVAILAVGGVGAGAWWVLLRPPTPHPPLVLPPGFSAPATTAQ